MFKPLLADPPDEKHALRFPFYVSPKLDGIRCIITPDGPRTRSLEMIPNRALAARLNRPEIIGLDGELIAGAPNAADAMQATSSAVMSHNGDADSVTFHVFDYVDSFSDPRTPYNARMLDARRLVERYGASVGAQWVAQTHCTEYAELMAHESAHVAAGFEGAMIRSPTGLYKFGRSTAREQHLMKLKRFSDAEGVVIGVYEREHNTNTQERSAHGYAKRSSAKAGKVAAGDLGGVVVRLGEPWKASEVRVGNGWTAKQRIELWGDDQGASLLGRLCRYKFQPQGSKDAPRIPVWTGWRDPRDMDSEQRERARWQS